MECGEGWVEVARSENLGPKPVAVPGACRELDLRSYPVQEVDGLVLVRLPSA